jgi:hypothetical protein
MPHKHYVAGFGQRGTYVSGSTLTWPDAHSVCMHCARRVQGRCRVKDTEPRCELEAVPYQHVTAPGRSPLVPAPAGINLALVTRRLEDDAMKKRERSSLTPNAVTRNHDQLSKRTGMRHVGVSNAMQDAELALATGARLAVQDVDNRIEDPADSWSISGRHRTKLQERELEQIRGGTTNGGVTHEDRWDGQRMSFGRTAAAPSNGGANGTDHWI